MNHKPGPYTAHLVARIFLNSGILPRTCVGLTKNPDAKLREVLWVSWRFLKETEASPNKWLLYFLTIIYIVVAYAFLIGFGLWVIFRIAN